MSTRPAAVRALLIAALLGVAACGESGEKSGSAVPDRSAARVRMAQALLEQGNVTESMEQLRKLPLTAENVIGPLAQPDWFEPVVAQLILHRNLFEADSLLALTGPVADRSSQLQALSANLMVLQGDTERAIATWAAIRTDDPKMEIQVHHELATLYLLRGRPDEAESECREGLVLDPGRWQLRLLLAESLSKQGRSDEALAEVQKMEAGVARWQLEARIELEAFDRPDRAVVLLSRANRAAPRNPNVRLQLAGAHIVARQYAEARVLLEPLANLPVPFSGSREGLIKVYEAVGEAERARVLREQLKAENDHDELSRFRVAGLRASMAGNLETALENFDQALLFGPDDADLHNDRGAILARMQRYEEAEDAFRKAEDLAPEDPVVQENLARLYHRTGETGLRDAALARWEELTGREAPRPE